MCTYSWPDSSLIAVITCSAMSWRALPGGAPRTRAENDSGAPILTSIRPGRGSTRPGGSTRRVPWMPTGRTGSPDFSASQPTPGRPRYSRPSGDRVPSG